MRKSVLRFLLCFMIVLLTLATVISCSKETSTPTTTPTETPTVQPTSVAPTTATPGPKSGGILKIITTPGLGNLGYPGESGLMNDLCFAKPCVERLTGLDPEGTGYPVPQLATGWEISDDYSSITFTLRQGVKFHDMTSFDAEAAKYSLDLHRTSIQPELKTVSSVDIIDGYTIRLNLPEWDPALLVELTKVPIVSPIAIETMGKECMTHPVGTGPFKFVSYTRDVSLKYEKFDSYWQEGKPYLDGIEFVFIADTVTALASFKKGEAQVELGVAPNDAADLEETGKFTAVPCTGGVEGMIGDSGHAFSPFSNLKVRQAISYAVDNAAIAKMMGASYYPPTNQWAPPTGWAYNPEVKGYPYNPEEAKKLLEEAGYGEGFQITIMCPSSWGYPNAFTAVQGYLDEVGIKATIDAQDFGTFFEKVAAGWNNGLVYYSNPASVGFDTGKCLTGWMSDTMTRYNPECVYLPSDYLAKLSKANTERDPQKRQALFKELMKVITDDYCMSFPIWVVRLPTVYADGVNDLDLNGFSPHDWNPALAWLSQ